METPLPAATALAVQRPLTEAARWSDQRTAS